MKTSRQVYSLVKKIPCGKVVTYGQIAKLIRWEHLRGESALHLGGEGVGDARIVGWILHANKSKDVPCHRVVDRNGRLAPNYGFGGAAEQRRRLKAEGVKFKDEMHIDIESCLWQVEFRIKLI